MKKDRKPTEAKEIITPIRCERCVQEWSDDESLSSRIPISDFQMIEAGLTAKGIQVWCRRHQLNVVHIEIGKGA
jgi:hypothetical protein